MDRNGRTTDLATTSATLAKWRREHGGRGRPIPEKIWGEAVGAARVHGVAETARTLGLDARRLAARMHGEKVEQEPSIEGRFVELPPLAAAPVATVLELVGRDGERVRVELRAGAIGSAELLVLAGAFWSRHP